MIGVYSKDYNDLFMVFDRIESDIDGTLYGYTIDDISHDICKIEYTKNCNVGTYNFTEEDELNYNPLLDYKIINGKLQVK